MQTWDDDDSYDDYDHDQYEDYDQYGDAYDDEYDDHYDDGPARTNRMAVWGLVFAFLFGPLGLILSGIGLRQVRRRGERGRGLAVVGLVVSLLWIAAGLWFGAEVAKQVAAELTAAEDRLDAAAVGTTPTAPAPTTVLEACTTMMPVLIQAGEQMTDAQTPEAAVQVVADMRAAVVWAGATPDAAFQQHLSTLAGNLQQVLDARQSGDVPPGLMETLEQNSFLVGKDCGLSGWVQ